MERWINRVAVVTGASSGIGSAIAIDLIKSGMIVVALGRREQRLIELRSKLDDNLRSKFHIRKCDVTDEDSVKQTFKWVDEHLGGVHVLVNNAGVMNTGDLLSTDAAAIVRSTVETNIMGVVYCTREAFNLMRSHGVDDGHIVVINSVCGHQTPNFGKQFPSLNIYPPTKHAITSMIETYRQELLRYDSKIRITSISPGAVDTEIFTGEIEHLVKAQMPMLKPDDISNAVLYAIAAPSHVQIYEMIIKPIGEVI